MDCLCSYLNDDDDGRYTLPQIQVPTTARVGMQSAMYPAAGQLAIRELVPHARIVEFQNCGPAIRFEQPRHCLRELGPFRMAA